MRNTLICTVGTSLFDGNLKHLGKNTVFKPENWQSLADAYRLERWDQVGVELLKCDPQLRICGAEINTIEEVRRKDSIQLEQLFLLVSDTPLGKATGRTLEKYFSLRRDLRLQMVTSIPVKGLQDDRPKEFKVKGLRNLVRAIGTCVQRVGGAEFVAIDATGGYKAQIAVALLMGQALDVPVFYKHERFSELIDFPPLPISFDYDLLGKYANILAEFESGEVLTRDQTGDVDEKLLVLLNDIVVEGQTLYELNPIGQIYLYGYRYRNPRPINLTAAEQKSPPAFRDDHYPKGFRNFVEKVWKENDWITSAHSLPYHGQKGIKPIGFHVREEPDSFRLIGTFRDEDNFGARFELLVTDSSHPALVWAADYLNRKYQG